jgi:putative resolvase
MRLSDWAKKNGISYRTAYRLFKTGCLPCNAIQLKTGTILLSEDKIKPNKVAIYGRVSSNDQKEDLNRQMNRLRDFANSNGFIIFKEVSDIASGLNGKRNKLIKLFEDISVTHIIVEHRDRLARFGVDYIESLLRASGRQLIVLNNEEYKDDLVMDFVDVVTSMCSRIYGRRSSRNRAKKALKAVQDENYT